MIWSRESAHWATKGAAEGGFETSADSLLGYEDLLPRY